MPKIQWPNRTAFVCRAGRPGFTSGIIRRPTAANANDRFAHNAQLAGRPTRSARREPASPIGQVLARPSSRLIPVAATAVAAATFALVLLRAIVTIDPYWDSLAYHWAYSARAAGICGRNCFMMVGTIEDRYDGFPLLLHFVQGLIWRLTGTPAMADLVNIAMIAALCAYLKHRFAVPLTWSWLALLAIPAVQIHLTSSYIDLPVNAAIAIALLVLLRMLVERGANHRSDVVIALLALGVAANSKFQMVPIAVAAWVLIVVIATCTPAQIRVRQWWVALVWLVAGGALVLLPKLAINAITYHNPFYPVAVVIGSFHFPGPEPMMQTISIANDWLTTPGPIRWLISVFEFDAFRGRPLPWTLGQGDVAQSSPSFRMGGYFCAYVLGAIALVGWCSRLSRAARWPALLLIVISVICACLPYSHDLRYYMFWMLMLVATMLILVYDPLFATPAQATQRGVAQGLIAVTLATVVLMTGAAYVLPVGPTVADLVEPTDATVARIPDGATLCILKNDRRSILYASLFHPPRRYRTQMLVADEPNPACTVRLDLDK